MSVYYIILYIDVNVYCYYIEIVNYVGKKNEKVLIKLM